MNSIEVFTSEEIVIEIDLLDKSNPAREAQYIHLRQNFLDETPLTSEELSSFGINHAGQARVVRFDHAVGNSVTSPATSTARFHLRPLTPQMDPA